MKDIKIALLNDMKVYMKAKSKVKLAGIRMANAAIKNKEIDIKRELTDEEIIAILKKQVKEHQESISFLKEEDVEARTEYEAYINALSRFIPEDMPREEAKAIAVKLLADNYIVFKPHKGQAMKLVMSELKGKIDGKVIQEIVDEILI